MRTDLDQSLDVGGYIADFLQHKSHHKHKSITELSKKRGMKTMREYEILFDVCGENLEEMFFLKLMKNSVVMREKVKNCKVGKSIIETVKEEMINVLKLGPEDTNDLQIKAHLSDVQLDTIRRNCIGMMI